MPTNLVETKKILYLVSGLGGGGYQRQLYYLLRQLHLRKMKVGVAVWRYDETDVYVERIQSLGVPVIDLSAKFGFAGRISRLRSAVRSFAPDFVHAYAFPSNFPAWMATRLLCPAIGSLRNAYWEERAAVGAKRGALCCKFPGLLVSNNIAAKNSAENDRTLFAPKRISYVGNAMDLGSFHVSPMPAGSRLELIGVGRLWGQKNWQRTFRMLKQLQSSDLNWRFRLFGNGPLEEALKEFVREIGLQEYVDFCGFTENVAREIASSHILISSSDYEGTSNSIMEAMACGRPVICTPAGDNRKLIENGMNGYVFDFDKFDKSSEAIVALAKDKDKLHQMGIYSRDRAEELFDLNRLADETLSAYCQLLS